MSIQDETTLLTANTLDLNRDWETTYKNILEYFETYVKPFYAFRDEPAYKAIISFIIKYYVEQIYKIQVDSLQQLYERHVIDQTLIDLLLVNIGLPEKLIKELTSITKLIIMKSFSDFERYKGTIKFFKNLGSSLPDIMSSYELYLDYWKDCVNPVGKYTIIINKSNLPVNSYFLISSTTIQYYVWFNFEGKGIDPKIPKATGIEIPYNSVSTNQEIAQLIVNALNITGEFFVTSNGTDILDIRLARSGASLSGLSMGSTKLKYKIRTKGKNKGCWVFRPRPIYVNPKTDPITDPLPYDDVVPNIPTWLLPDDMSGDPDDDESTDTGGTGGTGGSGGGTGGSGGGTGGSGGGTGGSGGGTGGSGGGTSTPNDDDENPSPDIITPTKTNIVLLDYTQSTSASLLNLLIFTILMEDIGEDSLPLYLGGSASGVLVTTYNNVFFLWYYLLARYHNKPLEGILLAYYNVMGTQKLSRYTPNDIPSLIKEYDEIDGRTRLSKFYYDNIAAEYNRLYKNKPPTISKMESLLQKTDFNLFEYVNGRLATSENAEQESRFMLDEIYASIALSFESYKSKPNIYDNIYLLLEYLPHITTNIKATDTYKLIYNLKPFHVELLTRSKSKIIIDDKFNSIMFEDATNLNFKLFVAAMMRLSDKLNFKFSPKKDGSALSMISTLFIMEKIALEDVLDWKDIFSWKFKFPNDKPLDIKDTINNTYNYYEFDHENIVTEVEHTFDFSRSSTTLAGPGIPISRLGVDDEVIVGDPVKI